MKKNILHTPCSLVSNRPSRITRACTHVYVYSLNEVASRIENKYFDLREIDGFRSFFDVAGISTLVFRDTNKAEDVLAFTANKFHKFGATSQNEIFQVTPLDSSSTSLTLNRTNNIFLLPETAFHPERPRKSVIQTYRAQTVSGINKIYLCATIFDTREMELTNNYRFPPNRRVFINDIQNSRATRKSMLRDTGQRTDASRGIYGSVVRGFFRITHERT